MERGTTTRRHAWTRRALLVTTFVAGAAASCASQGAETDRLDEEKCYDPSPMWGDVLISGVQKIPDGTEQAVEESTFIARKSGRAYSFEWNGDDLEYELSFLAPSDGSGAFLLDQGELCTRWLAWDESKRPPCATSTGDDRCEPGCSPVTGAGHVEVTMECGDSEDFPGESQCDETAEGEVAVLAPTMGQFRGSVKFSLTTRFRESYCSGGTFEDVVQGCSK